MVPGPLARLCLLLAAGVATSGDTVEVGEGLREGLWQAELVGAAPDSTFRFQPGIYRAGSGGCDVLLPPGVRLVAASATGRVEIDCEGTGRHFRVPAGGRAVVEGLTLRNGASSLDAGCILVDSGATIELRGSVLANCTATGRGGCIHLSQGSAATVRDSVLEDCVAEMDGGGVYASGASLLLDNSTVRRCSAGSCTEPGCSGGGVYGNKSNVVALAGNLSDNSAGYRGGALYMDSSVLTLAEGTELVRGSARYGGAVSCLGCHVRVADTVVRGCSATESGGGIALEKGSSVNASHNVLFLQNYAGADGGAIRVSDDGSVHLGVDIVFSGNRAGDDGGAVALQTSSDHAQGKIDLTAAGRVVFDRNHAVDDGGSIYLYHNVASEMSIALLGGVEMDACSADSSGGGIYAFATPSSGPLWVTMRDLRMDNCFAGRGGGFYVYGPSCQALITDSSFQGNGADQGGVVYGYRTQIRIVGSNFTGNTAGEEGGALWVHEGQATISGSTFGGNSAAEYGGMAYGEDDSTLVLSSGVVIFDSVSERGGALFVRDDSLVEFRDGVSIAGNHAYLGGAIYAHTRSSIMFGSNTECVGNSADQDSGCIHLYHECHLSAYGNVTFARNTAGDDAGAFSSQGYTSSAWSTLALGDDVFIRNNDCGDRGGAIYGVGLVALIVQGRVEFSENHAQDDGGAICLAKHDSVEEGANVDFSGAILFRENWARSSGGAIFVQNAVVSVAGVTMISNDAVARGGAMYLWQVSFRLSESVLRGNSAGFQLVGAGGSLYLIDTSSVISKCTITDSRAVFGGGIRTMRSDVLIANGTVGSGCTARYRGGFIHIRWACGM